MSLRPKFIIAVTILVIGVATILSVFFINSQKQVIRSSLAQRGNTLASNLSFNAEYGILVGNQAELDKLLEGIMKQPDVSYCLIHNGDGDVLSAKGLTEDIQTIPDFPLIAQKALLSKESLIQEFSGSQVYNEVSFPVISEQVDRSWGSELDLFSERASDGGEFVKKRVGTVRVGLSLASAERLEKHLRRTVVMITVFIIAIAWLITTLVARIGIIPIRKLVEGTHKIARGDLQYKVRVNSSDEFGLLAASFNKMTEDLKRSRDELVKAKDYTDNIIRSMIDILIVADTKGIIRMVNPAALKILGYRQDEIVGEPIDMIFSIEGRDVSPRVEITKQMLRDGYLSDFEMSFRSKSGESIPVLVSGAVMMNNKGELEGIVGIAKNITDRKRDEQALKESNERFNTVAANMPGMIYQFLLKPDGSIEFPYISPGCREILGIEPEAIAEDAMTVINEIHPEDREAFDKSVMLSAKTLEPWRWEGRYVFDGKVRWIQGASRPKKLADGSILWDGVLMDISERKVAQSLIELKTKMLEKVNKELIENEKKLKGAFEDLKSAHNELKKTQFQLFQSEKLKTIGHLASGVAHEVKNPLAIILQGVAYLESKISQDEEKMRSVLDDIEVAVHRADNVIKGVLDFSALTELDMEMTDINDIIDASLLLVKHEFNQNQIEVVKVASKFLPKIKVDKNKIEQVFVNILLNAVQAMPKGGKITIKTYPKTVTEKDIEKEEGRSSLDVGNEVVCVEIEDTGPGIPKQSIKKVFEPFFTTKAGQGGTGLGLSIIRNIIELHKGRVTIENRDEGGVRTTVILKA